jgi:hypothetical protein
MLPKELLQLAVKVLIDATPDNTNNKSNSSTANVNHDIIYEDELKNKLFAKQARLRKNDLWDFLYEINQELLHYKKEIQAE